MAQNCEAILCVKICVLLLVICFPIIAVQRTGLELSAPANGEDSAKIFFVPLQSEYYRPVAWQEIENDGSFSEPEAAYDNDYNDTSTFATIQVVHTQSYSGSNESIGYNFQLGAGVVEAVFCYNWAVNMTVDSCGSMGLASIEWWDWKKMCWMRVGWLGDNSSSTAGRIAITPEYLGPGGEFRSKFLAYAYLVGCAGVPGGTNISVTVIRAYDVYVDVWLRDTEMPKISILQPANNTVLSLKYIRVVGTATDNVYIRKVEFSLDGATWHLCNTTNNWRDWYCDVFLLSGANTLYARATDAGWNFNLIYIYVRVELSDTVLPSIQIISPQNGATVLTNTLLVSGRANDNVAVERVEVCVNDEPWQQCNGTDEWNAVVEFRVVGSNFIRARAIDTAGNMNVTVVNVNVIDVEKPTIVILEPANRSVLSIKHAVVSGRATDNFGLKNVDISSDGINWQRCNGTLQWRGTLTFIRPGLHTIFARAIDNANNTNMTGIEVTVLDIERPIISVLTPENNSLVQFADILFSGTASDNFGVEKVELSADGRTWVLCNGTEKWSGRMLLRDGENKIWVRVTDIAGNSQTIWITVTFQPVLKSLNRPGYLALALASACIVVAVISTGIALHRAGILRRRKRSKRGRGYSC